MKNDNKVEYKSGAKIYTVYKTGIYGPFMRIQKGKYSKNMKLPVSFDIENITLESIEGLFANTDTKKKEK